MGPEKTHKCIVKGVGNKPEYGEITDLRVKIGSVVKKGDKICDIKVQGKDWHKRQITLTASNDIQITKIYENRRLHKGDTVYEYALCISDSKLKFSDEGSYKFLANAKSFNGTIGFNKVMAFIHDTNAAEQSSANDSSKAISAISSIGAIGASVVGAAPIAALFSLGRIASMSSSAKKVWSHSDIEAIREVFELTQNEIRSLNRLGMAQGRFISKYKDRSPSMWSVFYSTSRGFNLVKLATAKKAAKCFLNEDVYNLMTQILQEDHSSLLRDLKKALYPCEITQIKGIRLVRAEEAKENDINNHLMCSFGVPYRFDLNDGLSFYGYKIPIPPHSDF